MEQALLDIISSSFDIEDCIDTEKLYKNTTRDELSWIGNLQWDRIQHFHIYGCEKSPDTRRLQERGGVKRGCYHDASHQWVLIVGAQKNRIAGYVSKCKDQLERLSVRFTTVRQLDVGHLTGLRRLDLSQNKKLSQVEGLGMLHDLVRLKLNDTFLGEELNLNGNPALAELHIGSTEISHITLDRPLTELKTFRAGASNLRDTAFLRFCPNLRSLVLQQTPIRTLPPLEQFSELTELNVAQTKLEALPPVQMLENLWGLLLDGTNIAAEDTVFPLGLRRLGLSGTPLRRLPPAIRQLRNLTMLNLSDLELEELPDWLPELGLEFRTGWGSGIILRNTQVDNLDMSIFSRSQETILKWFEGRKNSAAEPLNEVKVIFLGDGEAGKTHTIARLLKDGAQPENFTREATPGIVITDQEYEIGGRKVQVHFWDFGGQEILHSMHRMFLTRRTLYVVVVNVREGNQDERARYWLDNVNVFAKGAPVLLVLNKMDMNRNASVNETDLRSQYPALTKVVKMSALEDSRESFRKNLMEALRCQIGSFQTLESPFLPAWNRLKERLRTMSEPYIRGVQYAALSEECGVDGSDEIRRDLLEWFNDLGVSFCYAGSAKLEDYVILRPDWITNALYIILFNKIDKVKNGLVTHEAIHALLHPSGPNAAQVKRVLPGVVYSVEEVEFVLNVVRRFRLSFLVEDGVEFMPMLCDNNTPEIANEYALDPGTLEFHVAYDYLPNNVLHRLMVELRADLDRDNVWLTGARFVHGRSGVSAVVKSDRNEIRIFVRSEKAAVSPVWYLDTITDALERINVHLGLSFRTRQIIYKADGKTECFDYDLLLQFQRQGIPVFPSVIKGRPIQIRDILSQTDRSADEKREKLLQDMIRACQNLQGDLIYWDAHEDVCNTYIRNMLRMAGYTVCDQTRAGISAGGKQAGELDLEIRTKDNLPWTIFEAMKLTGSGKTQLAYWDEHLKKLLDHYNPHGLPFLVLVSYVRCAKEDFNRCYGAYYEHLRTHSPGQYLLQFTEGISGKHSVGDYIRVDRCVYDCGGSPTTVYHIFVHLGA